MAFSCSCSNSTGNLLFGLFLSQSAPAGQGQFLVQCGGLPQDLQARPGLTESPPPFFSWPEPYATIMESRNSRGFQFLEGHPAKYQTRGCRPALGNIPAENVSNLCESALFRLAASVFTPALAAKATWHILAAGRSIICGMVKPFIQPVRRRRGNPNWGRPIPPIPAVATEFEVQVRHLRLTKQTCVSSTQLSNRNLPTGG